MHEAEQALSKKPTLEEKATNYSEEHKAMKHDETKKRIEQYQSLSRKKDETSREITNTELLSARSQNKIDRMTNELTDLKGKEQAYEDNKEAIENLEALLSEKDGPTIACRGTKSWKPVKERL